MYKMTEQQFIRFKQKLDIHVDHKLQDAGILMHNTTLERIADAAGEFLVLEKIIEIKD